MTGKIYTKKGDFGETGLLGGKRVPKSDPLVEALGTIDELNAILGTLGLRELERIQREIMQINAYIAGFKTKIPSEKYLEKSIDKMQKELPELKNFILPKGPFHLARAVCRRAERQAVSAGFKIKYLNRLSDYLFVLARYVNFKNHMPEIIWKQN